MEIAITILELARNGIQKTRLVYRTNFNHTLMQKYLDYLMEKNLIEIVNASRPVYHTTEQGIELLEQFSRIRKVLDMREVPIDEVFQ
jgi:predicted transcriptional regulator